MEHVGNCRCNSAVKVESELLIILAAGQIESDKDQIVFNWIEHCKRDSIYVNREEISSWPRGDNRVSGQLVVSLTNCILIRILFESNGRNQKSWRELMNEKQFETATVMITANGVSCNENYLKHRFHSYTQSLKAHTLNNSFTHSKESEY